MWQIVGVNTQTHAFCILLITIVFEKKKKNSSRRGHRIGTTITFYSYFRNSLPNPPSYSYPGFIHIPDEDRHRTSKLLSSPGTEHNDLVMSSILESRQGPFLESPGNFNNGPQGFFLV